MLSSTGPSSSCCYYGRAGERTAHAFLFFSFLWDTSRQPNQVEQHYRLCHTNHVSNKSWEAGVLARSVHSRVLPLFRFFSLSLYPILVLLCGLDAVVEPGEMCLLQNRLSISIVERYWTWLKKRRREDRSYPIPPLLIGTAIVCSKTLRAYPSDQHGPVSIRQAENDWTWLG
ncbi:uncharacterized protein [Triticum aestivum]|uniref:uncharacterized protein n=1 Tax=Triticum aestivum TaxID=4565 RepID=UPI001D001A3B|nr:uncharacterized protein LOC123080899 [Triticum aestivum]